MLLCDERVPYMFENALETNKNVKKKEKLKLKSRKTGVIFYTC